MLTKERKTHKVKDSVLFFFLFQLKSQCKTCLFNLFTKYHRNDVKSFGCAWLLTNSELSVQTKNCTEARTSSLVLIYVMRRRSADSRATALREMLKGNNGQRKGDGDYTEICQPRVREEASPFLQLPSQVRLLETEI